LQPKKIAERGLPFLLYSSKTSPILTAFDPQPPYKITYLGKNHEIKKQKKQYQKRSNSIQAATAAFLPTTAHFLLT